MNNVCLYHHGIKGMKWGVRRTDAQLGCVTKKTRREKSIAKFKKKGYGPKDAEMKAKQRANAQGNAFIAASASMAVAGVIANTGKGLGAVSFIESVALNPVSVLIGGMAIGNKIGNKMLTDEFRKTNKDSGLKDSEILNITSMRRAGYTNEQIQKVMSSNNPKFDKDVSKYK